MIESAALAADTLKLMDGRFTKRFSMLQRSEHADCNGRQKGSDEHSIESALAARDVGLLLRDPVVPTGYHRRVLIACRGLRSNDTVLFPWCST